MGDERLLKAYQGSDEYVFVSYPHKEKEKAMQVVSLLQRNHVRVWFDEGIDPGTEWADNIAVHLSSASFFCACMSREYLESTNCCDELAYARILNIPIMLIYLEPLQLEGANEMRYEDCPFVSCSILSNSDSFCKAVAQSDQIIICREIRPEENSDV